MIELLSKNYVAVAQMANLMAEWLILAGAEINDVQQQVSKCMTVITINTVIFSTPQIAYRVTTYRVDSGYRVGFSWNQFILAISIVRIVLL